MKMMNKRWIMNLKVKNYKVTDEKFKLKEYRTDDIGDYKNKEDAASDLQANILRLSELQEKLYAQNTDSLVIIIQAMDAAGKDGLIKHVMTGVNPQGCHVTNFKQPSSTELDHDYLWRINKALPERGMIGIFNRSYYEDVLVVRVHDLIKNSQIPERVKKSDIWKDRFRQMKDYERYLVENGIKPIKIFLNVSKDEQKQRFLDRINEADKNWKFNLSDVEERKYWDEYMEAFEDAIKNTATKDAPWYVVPADKKWFARLLVSQIIIENLEEIDPKYPKVEGKLKEDLERGKEILLAEE